MIKSRRLIIATVAQVGGIAAIAAGLGLVTLWAGIVAAGIGAVALGIAIERADR